MIKTSHFKSMKWKCIKSIWWMSRNRDVRNHDDCCSLFIKINSLEYTFLLPFYLETWIHRIQVEKWMSDERNWWNPFENSLVSSLKFAGLFVHCTLSFQVSFSGSFFNFFFGFIAIEPFVLQSFGLLYESVQQQRSPGQQHRIAKITK